MCKCTRVPPSSTLGWGIAGPGRITPHFLRTDEMWSTRIKDAGIAMRHSRGRILFYTAGSRNGLEGVGGRGPKKLTPRERHFFVIEKHIEDVKQEEKDFPDLVEPIMRPTDRVKEEL